MKDKLSAYIEKLQPLLEKIKPWLKTKKAWVQIGLSVLAIVCLILAGVSSCSRRYVLDNPKATVSPTTATAEATEKVTETPEASATPEATALPQTAAPKATQTTSSSSNTISTEGDPVVPDEDITSKTEYDGPTGAPLYTSVPIENVDTMYEAYRTTVASCWGAVNYSSYYLHDMDGDGVEELIIHYGSDDYEAYIDVYTYTENGLVFVGDATGSFANISGCSDKGFIVYYRRDINGQKYESVEQWIKEGDVMRSNTIVVQAKVDEYTVLDIDEEITRYRIDDFSPFN